MKVDIVSKEHMRPSSPTPLHLRDFQLSFIDELIPPSYTPLIIYYSASKNKAITRHEMSHKLRRSLSDALVQYYPLAGRMKGQTLVDCNDEGIMYIEADADGMISEVVRMPDARALDKLIPFRSNGCCSSAEEQLAIQVTWFRCGGMSVGICLSHRIGDGCTLGSFIKCWAWVAMACGDDDNSNNKNNENVVSPVYNSATLFPARNTPDFRPNSRSPSVQPYSVKLTMKRFVFTSSAINELKVKVQNSCGRFSPTRVEVVSAFLWSRCLEAKRVGKSGKSVAYHPVSLRGKVAALTEHSFGNIFQMTKAENSGEETNWMQLAEKLRAAFGKIDSEFTKKLLGHNGTNLVKENFNEISEVMRQGNVEVFRFSSYCRFPFYEADFGWGKPIWVSSASFGNKDSVFLFDSVESGGGGIEAWIVMADQDMNRLEQDMDIHHFTTSFPL